MSTILIADDEDFLRLLIRQTLVAHEVIEASSGDEALALARDKRPDLIVLDWMMPGCHGPEVLAALREDEATRRVPVVMVTGRVSPDEQRELLALGANACIGKPFSPSELCARVEELLAGELGTDP